MHYTATHDTIEHIVELVVQVQPGWDAGLVRVVLHSHTAHVDGNDLAIAALKYACSPNAVGPKGIGWRGPHWHDLDTKPVEIKESKWCGVCGKLGEPRCRIERLADDDHEFEPTDRAVRNVR